MSDLEKLESATNKIQNLLDWAKQNTMMVGILITVIPAILVFGYNSITKFIILNIYHIKYIYIHFSSFIYISLLFITPPSLIVL